jgi:mannose-6-phosphate isomerase-like protein (cupin superfamily)
MIVKPEEKFKRGVLMRVYKTKQASIVYQETEKGHNEEFYHDKSTFTYYIISGKGSWFINGKEQKVKAGDVVVVEPGNRFYYKGKLKQILVTIPRFDAKYSHHVRDVKL